MFGARKFLFGTILNLDEVDGSGTQLQSLDKLFPCLTVFFKAQLKRWLLPTHKSQVPCNCSQKTSYHF